MWNVRRPSLKVELRFFAGLSVEDMAQPVSISPATAKRDRAMAKAWRAREMGGSRRSGPAS
jgi:hypothetical protein